MLYDNDKQLQAYPKRKYSSRGGSVVVQNSVEEALLGQGWSDTAPPLPSSPKSLAAEPKPLKAPLAQ